MFEVSIVEKRNSQELGKEDDGFERSFQPDINFRVYWFNLKKKKKKLSYNGKLHKM